MDGMFLGTTSGVLLDNFDIGRIEVLRGPQGTLFGKNTTGGILNVIRTPVSLNEMGADLSLTAGNFGRQDVNGGVQILIIEDTLGLKLFAATVEHDGHIRNTTRNENVSGDDKINYGFTALWAPTDSFDLKVHYEIMRDDSVQSAYVNRNNSYFDPNGGPNATNGFMGKLACTLNLIGLDTATGCEPNANDGPDKTESDGKNFSDNDYQTTIITAHYDTDTFL